VSHVRTGTDCCASWLLFWGICSVLAWAAVRQLQHFCLLVAANLWSYVVHLCAQPISSSGRSLRNDVVHVQ
jgi:hypothetical protein